MRKTPLVALALGITLALSACSGDDASETPAPTSAKDDAIAELVPEAIATTGKLVFGTDPSYAPGEFLGDDGTTPVGYNMELAQAIAGVLGLTAELNSSSFDAIIPAIGTRYDVGISSFTINPERMEQVNMISYISVGSAFAVAKGNPKEIDPTDICGLSVGVQTGTVQDEDLNDVIAPECEAAGKPAPIAVPHALQSDVTTDLAGGKVDLMYADYPVVAYAIDQTGDKMEQLGEVFDTAPQGVVVAKDAEDLTDAVHQAIQKIMDDGTYAEILAKWDVQDVAISTSEINPAS